MGCSSMKGNKEVKENSDQGRRLWQGGARCPSPSSDSLLGRWGWGPRARLLTLLPLPAAHIAEDTPDLLQHVKFQSSNFENILTWDSGPESAPDAVYSVEYKT